CIRAVTSISLSGLSGTSLVSGWAYSTSRAWACAGNRQVGIALRAFVARWRRAARYRPALCAAPDSRPSCGNAGRNGTDSAVRPLDGYAITVEVKVMRKLLT